MGNYDKYESMLNRAQVQYYEELIKEEIQSDDKREKYENFCIFEKALTQVYNIMDFADYRTRTEQRLRNYLTRNIKDLETLKALKLTLKNIELKLYEENSVKDESVNALIDSGLLKAGTGIYFLYNRKKCFGTVALEENRSSTRKKKSKLSTKSKFLLVESEAFKTANHLKYIDKKNFISVYRGKDNKHAKTIL